MSPSRVKRGGGFSPVRGMSPNKRQSGISSPKKLGAGHDKSNSKHN